MARGSQVYSPPKKSTSSGGSAAPSRITKLT
jgi:hypothetical protein